MKLKDLKDLANYFGYDWLEKADLPQYADRKGKVYALSDRRTQEIVCVYATTGAIEKWIRDNVSIAIMP